MTLNAIPTATATATAMAAAMAPESTAAATSVEIINNDTLSQTTSHAHGDEHSYIHAHSHSPSHAHSHTHAHNHPHLKLETNKLQMNSHMRREHTTKLEARHNLNQNRHPNGISLQVHSISLNTHSNGGHHDTPKAFKGRLQLSHRADKYTVSTVPYAHSLDFPLSYHSLLFDVIKINVLKQVLITWKRIGQVTIKLSELPSFQRNTEQHVLFQIVDVNNKERKIGELMLNLNCFYDDLDEMDMDFSGDEGLNGSLDDIQLTMSPLTMSPASSTRNSLTIPTPISTASPLGVGGMATALVADDTISEGTSSDSSSGNGTPSGDLNFFQNFQKGEYKFARNLHHTNSTSRSSTTLTSSSSHSSSSSNLSYMKRSNREALDSLTKLWMALTGTGWNLGKMEFAKGLGFMQQYYKYNPTPKTKDVIEDVNQLRVAVYFLNFTHASYGALALNYFGYGRLTDVLKSNQDYKAALSHLKMPKENMLIWQYESHGLFSQKPCFFVCYDEEVKGLVVCVRGTFGITDAITDLNAEYTPFLGGTAHGGAAQAALWIRDHHQEEIISLCKEKKVEGLYLVGHSLGGAVAALLLMLIREDVMAEFGEEFTCLAHTFATPPCISVDLVEPWKPFITTYINEYDPVPKCSYGSIMDLKEMLSLAASLSSNSTLTKKEKMEKLQDLQCSLRSDNKHPRLLNPGNCFLMYKTSRMLGHERGKNEKFMGHDTGNRFIDDVRPHYVVERTHPEHFDFMEIRADMVFCHLNNRYDNSLRKATDYLNEHELAESEINK